MLTLRRFRLGVQQRFQASVTSVGWRSAHRKVRRSRAPRIVSPLEVAAVSTGACEGSLFAEGVSVRHKASPFHEVALAAGLAVSLVSSCAALPKGVAQSGSSEGSTPLGRRRAGDGGIRGSIALSPWEQHAHASWVPVRPAPRGSTLQRNPPKRSSWRETTVYLGSSQEAARHAPEHGGSTSREHTRCGFSS